MRRHSPVIALGLALVFCCGAYLRLSASPNSSPLLEAKRIAQSMNAGVGRLIDAAPIVARVVRATTHAMSEAAAQPPEPPQVWTDKSDYMPGETAYMYGSGFTGDQTVTL